MDEAVFFLIMYQKFKMLSIDGFLFPGKASNHIL
jgi:hypothetical protein